MKSNRLFTTILMCIALAIGANTVAFAEDEAVEAQPNPALLDPTLAKEKAPDLFRVQMDTTAGSFVIEVHREWSPRGADRFYNLVKIGYFESVAFYRVITGFMAQVGMHGDPAVSRVWLNSRIQDDPVKQSNTVGMVTFAMGGQPNTRSAQIFINYGDNSYLDEMGFAPIGKVVEGYESVQKLYSGYGEGEPNGNGPAQAKLYRRGNPYLKAEFPKLDYIQKATILE
jgi:peptidyl-prolyl cis-trans isomerase A (cyclophilin A)